jgi:hypothetical protein
MVSIRAHKRNLRIATWGAIALAVVTGVVIDQFRSRDLKVIVAVIVVIIGVIAINYSVFRQPDGREDK